MEIVWPEDPNYNEAKQIANARFDYLRPAVICYCQNEDDVHQALHMAKTEKRHVRIRSGGHQHEGMCSGDNVLIIDVSGLNGIRIEGDTVRIGPGARLRDVYPKLWKARMLFPGGGCGDVCVGGLVQGGGWGPYGRLLGFTCDRLLRFRIVKADGAVLEVTNSPNDPHAKLFWAVCGGGGGNFGIVTEFLFRPGTLESPIWSFTAKWTRRSLVRPVIDEWRANFPGDSDHRLTSFARLSAQQGDGPDPAAIVAGFFVGDKAEVEGLPAKLLPKTYGAASSIDFDHVDKAAESGHPHAFQHPEYQPGPGDLSSTCAGIPYPHKISSCFPRAGFGSDAVNTIVDTLQNSAGSPLFRRYLSLHSLGGAMGRTNNRSCFPYRAKPFMLQYQAWWGENNYGLQIESIEWLTRFRDAMRPWTEGAFINFPDRDLVQFTNDDPRRKELLRFYYAGNMDTLIGIKALYDSKNFFDFEMGIPTS